MRCRIDTDHVLGKTKPGAEKDLEAIAFDPEIEGLFALWIEYGAEVDFLMHIGGTDTQRDLADRIPIHAAADAPGILIEELPLFISRAQLDAGVFGKVGQNAD